MGFSIKAENVMIEIDIVCRPYLGAEDEWDLNWLSCNISIRIPAYTVNFNTFITCGELKSFYDELSKLHQSLQGKASLSPLESGIFIDIEANKLGQIAWKVETQYPEGYGATLTFEFISDQSYLYQTLSELKSVIEEYPILRV